MPIWHPNSDVQLEAGDMIWVAQSVLVGDRNLEVIRMQMQFLVVLLGDIPRGMVVDKEGV